jgi:TRAP-type C4-dicarboxylate transport system permease small subunit
MKKIDYIEKLLELGVFLSFGSLVLVVCLQIFTRVFIPQASFVWTEEASRFLFIFAMSFGAPLAVKTKEYASLDILTGRLQGKSKKVLEIFLQVLTVLLFVIVLFQAVKFTKLGIGQTSPTMRIPMYISFSSMVVMMLFSSLYSILDLINSIAEFKK